jgi:hypothetical protein
VARHGTGLSSEAGTRPRGTTADRLVGHCRFLGHGPFFVPGCSHAEHVLGFTGMFVCVLLFFEKAIFPVIRGPLGLSPTVAPEPLQWCPLGTRRGWRSLMGHSSLLVVVLFRGGALGHTRVQPPKPWRSVDAPARFFSAFFDVRGVSFSWYRLCFSLPRRCHTHVLTFACVWCMPKRCSRVSSPRA